MTHLLRASALALVLLPLGGSVRASSAPAPQDTSALQFHGFRAGARLDELDGLIRRRHGGRLRCDRAKRDRRVWECRGVVSDSAMGKSVKVWVSAIDSVAGVITLSADMDRVMLDRWRRTIESRYGRVSSKVQGSQRMMQWVRRGRMLRLTWRTDRGERTASVSLVDGRVLDAWGQKRAAASPQSGNQDHTLVRNLRFPLIDRLVVTAK
jgi:hypothetical protein